MKPFELLWEYPCDGSVISVAATPNCSTVVAATVGKSVYLLDGSGTALWDRPFEVDAEAWAAAISDDGRYIAIGTASKTPADGTLFVLTRDGKLFWSKRIRAPIWSVAVSSDGEMLAASTWGSNCLHLLQRTGSEYAEVARVAIPGESGLYGTTLTPNGQLCVVASYESGLYAVEPSGAVIGRAKWPSGLYNVALASGANVAVAGTRDGTFAVAALDDDVMQLHSSATLSQRPICGVAATENGLLVACGSFDGRVIVANDRGGALWDFQTNGEVWTTAISTDGALVCAGSGDLTVRMFRNACDAAAYREIVALENAVSRGPGASSGALRALIDLYLKYRVVDYGYARLTQMLRNDPEAHFYREQLRKFLEVALADDPGDTQSAFHLAELLAGERRYLHAAKRFQQAAHSPMLKSSAQRRAAECFTELRLPTAATAARRQSREQHLDDNARQILYMLARSYEDCGDWHEASRIYEMILSWDADFRNSWAKLSVAKTFSSGNSVGNEPVDKDYTGATISLLGPEAPRVVDPALCAVVAARSRELVTQPDERNAVRTAVAELFADERFSRGLRRDSSHLGYDIQLFLKYDFGLPEDEMKKFLETVNALPYFEEQRTKSEPRHSLDIGSATGRYPLLLTRLGFRAYGIDIEAQAIAYATREAGDAEWPKFVRGDARALESFIPDDVTFHLITCMMGTFEHIPRDEQPDLVAKMFAKLRPGGVAIISVWDVECPHLAYLSLYDEAQKELIRKNSRTRDEMRELLTSSHFTDVAIRPFSLLPQTAIYDLGIERMKVTDIEVAAQADLAARALYGDRHGEMFLAIGRR